MIPLMMNWTHFYLLFYIFALGLGFVNIALSAIYMYRTRLPWVKYYFVFLVIFTLILTLYAMRIYAVIVPIQNEFLFNTVLGIIIFLSLDFLIYFLPYFVTWMIAHPWRNPVKITFIVLSVVFAPLSVFYMLSGFNLKIYAVMMGLFFGMMFYCAAIILKNYNSIQDKKIRTIMISYIILSACLTPLMIIDTFMAPIGMPVHAQFPTTIATLPFFYTWFTIFILIYLVDYFINIPEHNLDKPDPKKMARFKVSNREKDVVECIFDGMTYKEIADKLCISVNTVNNHMANIFGKVEVRSRFDLIKQLK